MNSQEIFDAWKARKSRDDVGREFTDRVMAAIHRREAVARSSPAEGGWATGFFPRRRFELWPKAALGCIAARPWAKAAAMIAGTLLGLARIIATLHLILFA